ncbi:DUF1993 domain-containing protein [Janthinobacterium rivuli]|uniref:DUF1993 domain-containing protein n=1 Tax=Janthinobacterium rivuli TaxID=2751478 RepID=A0ABY8I0J8_9BURK|nr:DUF1993 domain-containing protein [Janthinobacterium rivuli]WFR77931.1 DUF1993 domain-containing protein [Janthinobacterium rivuli]
MTDAMHINPATIFCRSLAQLSAMLDTTGTAPQLLAARLHPDMLPFAQQVRAAVSFSLRGCCPLAGLDVADFSAAASLQEQIAQTMRYLKDIPVERFDGPLDRICRDRAGFADIALPADEYLNLYILPNFYFHFSMAYAIARSQGAAIGKGDFDGYHAYAPGFSFETPAAS